MENVRIYEITEAAESLLTPLNALLSQLSSTPRNFTLDDLAAIVQSPNSHLFVVEIDGVVGGMLTLGDYLAPTGRKMWIEDVVVDSAVRGHSFGRAMVEHAIIYAKDLGCGTLMLTSRPSRVAANALYRSCDFEQKETNVYKMNI